MRRCRGYMPLRNGCRTGRRPARRPPPYRRPADVAVPPYASGRSRPQPAPGWQGSSLRAPPSYRHTPPWRLRAAYARCALHARSLRPACTPAGGSTRGVEGWGGRAWATSLCQYSLCRVGGWQRRAARERGRARCSRRRRARGSERGRAVRMARSSEDQSRGLPLQPGLQSSAADAVALPQNFGGHSSTLNHAI